VVEEEEGIEVIQRLGGDAAPEADPRAVARGDGGDDVLQFPFLHASSSPGRDNAAGPWSPGEPRWLDAVLLGRVTYQLFADYWPSSTDPEARALNDLPKIVFSRTLEKVEWRNSRLVREDAAGEVTRLKGQRGKDLALFGSADLASTFTRLGLIDEYRILVAPVVLGAGHPMFKDVEGRFGLRLSEAETFGSGVVMLRYRPA
jgi:dihydrofolate reductase